MKRLLLLFLLVLGSGCLDRTLVVKPDPEDAHVFVDGQELPRRVIAIYEAGQVSSAVDPAEYRYEHYGIHKVVVRKLGYEAKEQIVTLDPPWYQVFPIDFVTDVLWPGTIEDRREVEIKLEPRADLQDADKAAREVIERARKFAEEAK
ncbi:MAG TPA: hypothetical protein VFF73_01520 [Planctomycetota bacterium]|nr:hypothetical protein [Planctomycetota bacterium]